MARVLGSTALFGRLDADSLARLAAAATPRTYDRGQQLCRQGEPGEWFFVIASGRVKVVLTSEEGQQVVLATSGPFDTLGELAALDRGVRSASVTAMETTTVLVVTRSVLLDVMAQSPFVLDMMLRSLGGLVRRLTEQAGDFVFLDLGGRLAKLLLRLADAYGVRGDQVVLDMRMSQTELAAMVGATRPALNRALQMFASRGWVSIEGQVIVLRNVGALEKRAGG